MVSLNLLILLKQRAKFHKKVITVLNAKAWKIILKTEQHPNMLNHQKNMGVVNAFQKLRTILDYKLAGIIGNPVGLL